MVSPSIICREKLGGYGCLIEVGHTVALEPNHEEFLALLLNFVPLCIVFGKNPLRFERVSREF